MKIHFKIPAFFRFWVISILFLISISCNKEEVENNTPIIKCIITGLKFAEGPAFYNGNLYFSVIDANTIYSWNEKTGVNVFRDNSGGANGLFFDNNGSLFICEGSNKRITSISADHQLSIVTDSFDGKPYNEPNDLWVSPNGNIYFTDPVYKGDASQEGEYVYCIGAANGSVTKVAVDLVKPNGIVGTNDGSILYIADWGASKIYKYSIEPDGSLGNKTLFANVQADGLAIDNDGNLYAASSELMEFNTEGEYIKSITIPGAITNLCFENNNSQTLYITTHEAVFTVINK